MAAVDYTIMANDDYFVLPYQPVSYLFNVQVDGQMRRQWIEISK